MEWTIETKLAIKAQPNTLRLAQGTRRAVEAAGCSSKLGRRGGLGRLLMA